MKKFLTFCSIFAFLVAGQTFAAENYNPRTNPPTINPSDFTTEIDNPYFSLPIGKKLVYESETEDGLEKIVIMVPGWTKTVQGVETLVFWDRVYLDDEIIEDTRDYLAQHKETGDVWYFGEHVDNYEDGKIVDHDGAWWAGVDGAIAGKWIPGNPQVGDYFMNELLRGEAEDESEIVGINETVETPFGTFTQCVKSLDGSPLFPQKAWTYHCKDSKVQGTAFEVDLPNYPDTSEQVFVKLIDVDLGGALGIALPQEYAKEGVKIDGKIFEENEDLENYNPKIIPSDFTSQIEGNQYFDLPVGTVLHFEAKTKDGLEKITIEILPETVEVNGVETRVYLDTVYLDGQLVEQTRDYIAQNRKTGDVWYFGEDVNNYEDGKLADHDGAWLYGRDGALPGIWVKANPKVGEIYLQEYLEGEAEDMVEILSLSETINVGGKTYSNCLKTYDFTPLDEHSKEHKYYCPEVGNLVYLEHLVDGDVLNLIARENNEQSNNTILEPYKNEDDVKIIQNFYEDKEDSNEGESGEDSEDEEDFEEILDTGLVGLMTLLIGGVIIFFSIRKQK